MPLADKPPFELAGVQLGADRPEDDTIDGPPLSSFGSPCSATRRAASNRNWRGKVSRLDIISLRNWALASFMSRAFGVLVVEFLVVELRAAEAVGAFDLAGSLQM